MHLINKTVQSSKDAMNRTYKAIPIDIDIDFVCIRLQDNPNINKTELSISKLKSFRRSPEKLAESTSDGKIKSRSAKDFQSQSNVRATFHIDIHNISSSNYNEKF